MLICIYFTLSVIGVTLPCQLLAGLVTVFWNAIGLLRSDSRFYLFHRLAPLIHQCAQSDCKTGTSLLFVIYVLTNAAETYITHLSIVIRRIEICTRIQLNKSISLVNCWCPLPANVYMLWHGSTEANGAISILRILPTAELLVTCTQPACYNSR